MATTNIHSIKSTETKAVKYILNSEKTENGKLITGCNCHENAKDIAEDFETIRDLKNSHPQILSKHIIQSFKGNEITPEEAHQLGIELCDKLLKGQYQYVIATHTNTDNVHNHIIFNNVNWENGKTFTTLEDRNKNEWKKVREISDEICVEHNISVIKDTTKAKGKSWYEWDMKNKNLSWKKQLKNAIDNIVIKSSDFNDFLKKCEENNIEVVYNPAHKIDLKFKLKGMQKYARAKTLGWYYETPQLKRAIELCNKILKGEITVQHKSNLIDTSQEKFIENFGLHNWAVIKNMQNVSKALNILTAMKISNSKELLNEIDTTRNNQLVLKSELNSENKKYTDLKDIQSAEEEFDFYRVYFDEMNSRRTKHGREKYADEHATELDRYKFAIEKLRKFIPEGKFPSPQKVKNEIGSCRENIKNKNSDLTQVNAKLKDLEFCRKTIESLIESQNKEQELQNEKSIEQEITHKRKHNDDLE